MTAISVRERLRGAADDGPGLLAAIHVTAVLGTADAMIDDVAEAEAATERLAAAPPDDAGLAVRDMAVAAAGSARAGSRRCRGLCALQGIATATSRQRLASRDISPGPRPGGKPCSARALRLSFELA
jgi:hypothetical protein